MALDLEKLQKQFDEKLAKETRLSLFIWLYKDRLRQWWYNFKRKILN
jgi:hypothetical protein